MRNNNLILKGFDFPKKYLEKNSLDKNRITFLTLETKPVCNQNCLYCSQEHRFKEKNSGNNMTLEEYENLISQSKEFGVKTVVFAGAGEPTLDKNLPEIIEFNFKLGLTSVIFTNLLCSKELIKLFYDKEVSLIIKLDTLKKETYKKLNGGIIINLKII